MHFLPKCLLFALLSFSCVQAISHKRGATVCNGHSELCDRSYGNVTFVGAHDSYAVGTNNLAVNQDQNVTQQLNDGIRMLQMQAHNDSGVIQLCHTSCLLYNGGTLASYLDKVATWMSSNPNDVVSILIVNSDGFAPSAFDAVFKAAGLDTISYAPPSSSLPTSGWPTLGAMITSGKRLVTFLDRDADFGVVPYLIDEFTNIWETPYDVTDPSFDCSVNRTKGTPATQMYLINHFLDVLIAGEPAPDPAQANVTNAASGFGSLGAQALTCIGNYGVNPNFMLVDFYEFGGGSVFEVAASLNAVTYSPPSPIATPVATGTGSGAFPTATNIHVGAAAAISASHWVISLSVIASVSAVYGIM